MFDCFLRVEGEVCKVVDAIVNPKVADALETDVGLA